jgi:His-Xaa-Ser system radical SAM maturase HxsB
MRYASTALPFAVRRLPDGSTVAVSTSGDFEFLSQAELDQIRCDPSKLPLARQAKLRAGFFLGSGAPSPGLDRLLRSRQHARRETVSNGPALHIIVPTLQCAHSCRYCQVSRSLDDTGHTISKGKLDAACDSVFESDAPALTVEFQGGDPLLRFDLVQHAITRIHARNANEGRRLRFVVASTLHQLDAPMCEFFKSHGVYLSTSIDGPAWLHNKNRPTPTKDAYERTIAGIELARRLVGADSVSALMTTTRASLDHPEAIVDEYASLNLRDIFLRPLSAYGFAKRNQLVLSYSLSDFHAFYTRAIDRVLYWNQRGVPLREVYASIILNKLLSPFDAGYVDLQSPTGAGRSVLVYNYDGYVYPSDEARMLAEAQDTSLRLGPIGTPLAALQSTPTFNDLVAASSRPDSACASCAYNQFCSHNPVDSYAQHGSMFTDSAATEHCQRHMNLFDYWLSRLRSASGDEMSIFHRWATVSE